jgi:hypothetical protein
MLWNRFQPYRDPILAQVFAGESPFVLKSRRIRPDMCDTGAIQGQYGRAGHSRLSRPKP